MSTSNLSQHIFPNTTRKHQKRKETTRRKMTRRRRQSIALIVAVVSQFYVATSQQSLETNFDGTLHASGQIFEVVAKSQAISITSFDVNMDAGTDEVSVYSRPGDLVASDDGLWLLISAFNVTGQGRGLKTSLPSFDFPVVVPAGLKQSFYVATNSTTIDFWYSTGTGTELGTVLASNDDMDVYEGYAIGNAWRGYAVPRQWNGVIYYSTGGTVTPTASPVLTTASPSTSSASAVSSQPSSYPSLLPTSGFVSPPTAATAMPTKEPTKQPTVSPKPSISLEPSTTNFKEPRSDTIKPTRSPESSGERLSCTLGIVLAGMVLARR